MSKRVFWIVLDSVGCGEAPDAEAFGDKGSDTLGSCVRSGLLDAPNLTRLGLYNIEGTSFRDPKEDVTGCYCRMQEQSDGKDTTVGHWEMAGMISYDPLPTYPDGFPEDVLDKLREATGRDILCNKTYSGMKISFLSKSSMIFATRQEISCRESMVSAVSSLVLLKESGHSREQSDAMTTAFSLQERQFWML